MGAAGTVVFLLQVVRGGLGNGLRRGEQRVWEGWRVGQRPLSLGLLPVSHQPAGDGDGHGHEGEEGGDDQGDDEPDLGHAHLKQKQTCHCQLYFLHLYKLPSSSPNLWRHTQKRHSKNKLNNQGHV